MRATACPKGRITPARITRPPTRPGKRPPPRGSRRDRRRIRDQQRRAGGRPGDGDRQARAPGDPHREEPLRHAHREQPRRRLRRRRAHGDEGLQHQREGRGEADDGRERAGREGLDHPATRRLGTPASNRLAHAPLPPMPAYGAGGGGALPARRQFSPAPRRAGARSPAPGSRRRPRRSRGCARRTGCG